MSLATSLFCCMELSVCTPRLRNRLNLWVGHASYLVAKDIVEKVIGRCQLENMLTSIVVQLPHLL